LLADLPRTAERITWRDRLAAASAATSLTNLMLLGFGFAAFGLVSALQLVGLVGQAYGHAFLVRLVANGMGRSFSPVLQHRTSSWPMLSWRTSHA